MAASGSTKVVIAALGANALIAIAKFSAAAYTGSAAMLSEAIHSLADTANQGLLLYGARQARRPADDRHPFGYARELYFWAFVVAVLLFSLGAGVAMYEGIHKLRNPQPVTDPWVNYTVLGVAMVCEAVSIVIAWREFDRQRGSTGAVQALRGSKDPALFTVLLEDFAALAGLAVALAGLVSANVFDWASGDAIASIVIGIILGLVAAFMAVETKALLIGEAATPEMSAAILALIRAEMSPVGAIAHIDHLKTMHLGPDDVLVAASLGFKATENAATVQATVARLETKIRARFPEVRHLYLEAQAPTSENAALENTALENTPSGQTTSPPKPPGAVTLALPTHASPAPRLNAPASPSGKGNYPPSHKAKSKKRRR